MVIGLPSGIVIRVLGLSAEPMDPSILVLIFYKLDLGTIKYDTMPKENINVE